MEAEHPRWGLIQSVVAKKHLTAGMEVLTHYGYTTEDKESFSWYWEAKEAINEERDNEKINVK